MIGSSFRHLNWDISFLKDNPVVRSKDFGITKEAKSVHYSTRLLRYWFGYHLLQKEFEKRGRPLSVAEIGVDTGQFLLFVKSALSKMATRHSLSPLEWKKWTAFDAILPKEQLFRAGYTECRSLELQNGDCQAVSEYDAVILLHVLEHLFEPEEALREIAANLRLGAVIIGGFPVHFDWLVPYRQAHLRKSARSMGHVSVFSPKRVVRMAKAAGLELEFLTGAFFCRWKGSRLENSSAWLRFNLAWGSWFSSWPGEVYWQMRKIA